MTTHKDEWKAELRKEFLGRNVYQSIEQLEMYIETLLASQKKEWVEKLKIAKEPLPAITMSAKEAVSFNRGIDTAIALIQE